jgi:hypothetical protein
MRHGNPYIDWGPNMATLVDRLNADVKAAVAGGAGQARRVLALIKEAGDEWGCEWPHKQKMKTCEGTPFYGPYLRLAGMLQQIQRQQRKSRVTATGVVYFLAAGAADIVKIGFTTNLDGRIRSLKTGSPTDVEVLLAITGTMTTERELHKRFAADRLRGEWFRRSAPIEAFIAERRRGKAITG